jgi:ornithine cyclodeaminase
MSEHSTSDIRILGGRQVDHLLAGREIEIIRAVREAYLTHHRGGTSLPHSIFLRFPGAVKNRIIGLPAFLDGAQPVAGMKWIASFPGNLELGLSRASAVMILNSCATGRPVAIVEASIISARRTAASAALAALELTSGQPAIEEVGLIGTGLINLETSRFLAASQPSVQRFVVFDLDRPRAERFAAVLSESGAGLEAEVAPSLPSVLERCRLIAFATTAAEPHVSDLSPCPPGATLLHTSLRDLSAGVVLRADNVVDDVDHVCREGT